MFSTPTGLVRFTFFSQLERSDILTLWIIAVSKDELRAKLAELYKVDKAVVSVFGVRTQFGGGKSTGFALIYDSHDSLKKFEPHYRLVRYGDATKIEKASRQQSTSCTSHTTVEELYCSDWIDADGCNREAAQEQGQGNQGYRSEGREEGKEGINTVNIIRFPCDKKGWSWWFLDGQRFMCLWVSPFRFASQHL